MTTPLWISEAEVVELLDLGEAISALEAGLRLEAAGKAQNMVKTHALWGGGHTLHAIGALFPDSGFVGTKTWAHTEGGATPLLILFDSNDGSLKAIIEAFALGQMRTGGISGVATRWLAAPDADDMALIGTGKQAMTQLAAVAAVRRLKRLRVFSPTPEKRDAFVARVRQELDLRAEAAASVEAAVKDASIVTLVTRARSPFLSSAMVTRGAHINAVGAIAPERIEFSPELLERCRVVVGDSIPQIKTLSREFIAFYGESETAWQAVQPLSVVVAAERRRPPDADLTLFKAMGMGISDLSLGTEIFRLAQARGLGRPVPRPQRAKPRLTATCPT
jgi:ornithine cyclodeaminase